MLSVPDFQSLISYKKWVVYIGESALVLVFTTDSGAPPTPQKAARGGFWSLPGGRVDFMELVLANSAVCFLSRRPRRRRLRRENSPGYSKHQNHHRRLLLSPHPPWSGPRRRLGRRRPRQVKAAPLLRCSPRHHRNRNLANSRGCLKAIR